MGQKFSFFDLDENILHLRTPIYIYHKKTGERAHIFPRDLSAFESGRILRNYSLSKNSFINFRDSQPDDWDSTQKSAQKSAQDSAPKSAQDSTQNNELYQQLYIDLEESLKSDNWQGPSWEHFKKAVECGDPISIITARRHEPETIAEALAMLVARGHLSAIPNFLAILPVWNPRVQEMLTGAPFKPHTEATIKTPALKALALKKAFALALENYGAHSEHRFGISDDDPQNISALRRALVELKMSHPKHAFFLYDCSQGSPEKSEITLK